MHFLVPTGGRWWTVWKAQQCKRGASRNDSGQFKGGKIYLVTGAIPLEATVGPSSSPPLANVSFRRIKALNMFVIIKYYKTPENIWTTFEWGLQDRRPGRKTGYDCLPRNENCRVIATSRPWPVGRAQPRVVPPADPRLSAGHLGALLGWIELTEIQRKGHTDGQ